MQQSILSKHSIPGVLPVNKPCHPHSPQPEEHVLCGNTQNQPYSGRLPAIIHVSHPTTYLVYTRGRLFLALIYITLNIVYLQGQQKTADILEVRAPMQHTSSLRFTPRAGPFSHKVDSKNSGAERHRGSKRTQGSRDTTPHPPNTHQDDTTRTHPVKQAALSCLQIRRTHQGASLARFLCGVRIANKTNS